MNPAAPETMIRKQISWGLVRAFSSLAKNGTFGADRREIDLSAPTTPEIILFLALLAASTYAFLRRILPVVRTIRRSKTDADYRVAPVAPRIRQFVWEVLLQGKVIRE